MGKREDTVARIRELAAPVCRDHGCELFLVEYLGAGRNAVLRVYIDREGGVGLDDCRRVSEALSVLLDVEDPIQHPYHLEVSSPGVERPLRDASDCERYVGRRVRVVTKAPVLAGGQTTVVGALVSCAGQVVRLRTDDSGDVEIHWENVRRANLEFVMGTER